MIRSITSLRPVRRSFAMAGSNAVLPLILCLLLLAGFSVERAQAKTADAFAGQPVSSVAATTGGADLLAAAPAATPDAAPPAKAPAKAKKAKAKPKPPAESSVQKLLKSAGRTPGGAQPEPGFLLTAPDSIRDGEAFLVGFAAQGAKQVTVNWRGKTLQLAEPDARTGQFQALLPVALDEKAKSLPLSLTVAWENGRSETFKADLRVKKGKYPIQRLNVDQKFVSPPASMQPKIKQDRAEMRAAISKITPRQYWTLPLLRPVPGEVTSLYGLRRVFNGVPKSPHRGVDFDGKLGDPIKAVEDGKVVLVSDHYYGGQTVVVDHGLGVFSVYLHLSGFNVETGQTVSRGDVVGFVGSTGRVTGPHLHFSFYVLGESVNGAAAIAM